MKKILLSLFSLLVLGCVSAFCQGTDLNKLSDLEYFTHHLKVISADDFGGRKPLTPYETKTINYIRDQYVALGLNPADDSGYFQDVEEIKTGSSIKGGKLTVKAKKSKVVVSAPDEIVAWTLRNCSRVDIKDAELVFAGYGATAPEYSWDDFEDVDVKGKVLLVLERDPGSYDETIFNGSGMTYYGRAGYKYEEAFKRGAAGCLVIHMPQSSAYKFAALQAAHGEQEISLADANGNKDALGMSGWIAEDAVRRIFKAASVDYEAALASARSSEFKALPLGVRMSATMDVKAEVGTSHNVIGMIPGTDLKDECVVVVAHWDHLGIGAPVDGDSIYNGAGDNASGVAGMLTHIRRFIGDGTKFRRSVIFAALTSEEDGLLGSEWYSKHPVMPASKTAAAVNIDGGAPLGKSTNIEVYAGGLSTVDEIVSTLGAAQGRRVDIINPDTRGIFFRTDLFNFLRAGVPGVFVCGGQEWVDPEDHKSHFNPPYHHPKDEWRDDWDMSGVMDHWNLIHALIEAYANQTEMPSWLPGCGFSRPVNEYAASNDGAYRFDFGCGEPAEGYTRVSADSKYSAALGYGFDGTTSLKAVQRNDNAVEGDFITSEEPFKFSVKLPEGNYKVTLTLGDVEGACSATIKAEERRLMYEHVLTDRQTVKRSFGVNIRNHKLSEGNAIKFDVREWDPKTDKPVTNTWDDRLTIMFSGENVCVCAVEIEPVEDAITVFLMGDSTVTDQVSDPYGTWGQCLTRWFDLPVIIANHAESGQTAKGFRFQRRWDKLLDLVKPGDYVFIQFGHNDLNDHGHDAMWAVDDKAGEWIRTYADAHTDYKWALATYALEVKRHGAIPVIVTPMTKLDLRSGVVNIAGMKDYPQGAREAAELAECACIDLNAMSITLAQALGTAESPKAYVDGLHSNYYGGYMFSRCIVEGIKALNLDLARYLREDAGSFDPAHPSPMPSEFNLPLDPKVFVPAPPGWVFPARNVKATNK